MIANGSRVTLQMFCQINLMPFFATALVSVALQQTLEIR